MSQNLSQIESLTIAHWFTVAARALTNAATQPGLSGQQVTDLTNRSNQLATTAANMATNAVQVIFTDADSAFTQISDAASQAAKVADQLSGDISKINNILDVAGKLVSFGTAVLTGSYGTAIGILIAAVGKPTSGQGANAPLTGGS
jgi:hypothetical protein